MPQEHSGDGILGADPEHGWCMWLDVNGTESVVWGENLDLPRNLKTRMKWSVGCQVQMDAPLPVVGAGGRCTAG